MIICHVYRVELMVFELAMQFEGTPISRCTALFNDFLMQIFQSLKKKIYFV